MSMRPLGREGWQAVLDSALEERAELDSVIAYASRQLGIEAPQGPMADEGGNGGSVNLTGEPSASVVEGQFVGMSGPKAAKALLERFGRSRPMKTDEIYAAVKKGGVNIGSSAALYRSLTRDDAFFKVARGRWGLSEWYPDRLTKSGSGGTTPDEEEDLGSLIEPEESRSDGNEESASPGLQNQEPARAGEGA
jgi:hypothetical protein